MWTKFWLNPWFGGFVICALASVVSFFQIQSYWADQHHFNGIFGWLGIGIILGVAAILFLLKANKTTGGKGG